MMILLVEDDERKMNQVVDYISSKGAHYKVDVRRSYNSGLKAVMTSCYDLILLDMSLPTFDVSAQAGGRPMAYAGRELLEKVARRKFDCKVSIITQFDYFGEGEDMKSLDQLTCELVSDFGDIFLGTIYFSSLTDEWKERLSQLLIQVGEADAFSANS